MKQAHCPHAKSCQTCKETHVDLFLSDRLAIPTAAGPTEDQSVLLEHPQGPAILAGLSCEDKKSKRQKATMKKNGTPAISH